MVIAIEMGCSFDVRYGRLATVFINVKMEDRQSDK